MATCMYGLERLLSSCYRDRCLIWVVVLRFRQGSRGGQGARQKRQREVCVAYLQDQVLTSTPR